MDVGLLVLRLVLGGFVAAHGVQKLTRFWGGGGLAASTEEFRRDGFAGGVITALLAGGTQFGSGLATMLGLVTPVASAGLIGVMAVAVIVKRPHGFWSQDDGYEYPILLTLLGVVVALAGPGAWSLDRLLGLITYWTVPVGLVATVVGVLAAVGLTVALRRNRVDASE